MTAVFGVVTIIALVAAVSILTIASYSCIKPMADELFKSKEKTIKTDIDGGETAEYLPIYDGDNDQKARDTIRKLPSTLRFMYYLFAIGPLAIVCILFNIKFDLNSELIVVRTAIPLESAITISNYMYEGFLFVIGIYFFYVSMVVFYISRVAIPFFQTFKEIDANS